MVVTPANETLLIVVTTAMPSFTLGVFWRRAMLISGAANDLFSN
jgi:hypothetical protein